MNMLLHNRRSFGTSIVVRLLFGAVLLTPFSCPVGAAESPGPADFAQQKREALRWLDTYAHDSTLFSPKDIELIRETVAHMTPTELEKWLKATKQLREYVQSPSWQATKRWLRQFLKVQAIYSDEEIKQFHQRVREADPEELIEIMQDIQRKHASLGWMHKTSVANQKAAVAGTEKYLKASEAAAARARKAGSSSSRPLFGKTAKSGTGGNVQKRGYKGYRTPRPLITSREVARESVRQSLFPRGGWYGW